MKPARFYELIGRFCIEFEEACRQMERCATDILIAKGKRKFSIERQLAHYTAFELQLELKKLLLEVFVDEDRKETVALAFDKVQSLVQRRNILMHTRWIPPIADEIFSRNRETAIGENTRPRRKGKIAAYLYLSEDELIADLVNCKRAQDIAGGFCMLLAVPTSFYRVFRITEKKLVIFPDDIISFA